MWSKVAQRISEHPQEAAPIKLLNYALGNTSDIVRFNIANEIVGHSGLKEKLDYGRPVTLTEIVVVLRKLDDLIDERKADPYKLGMIKFDLEGGEYHAFRGAADAIKKGQPLIMFECGAFDA